MKFYDYHYVAPTILAVVTAIHTIKSLGFELNFEENGKIDIEGNLLIKVFEKVGVPMEANFECWIYRLNLSLTDLSRG